MSTIGEKYFDIEVGQRLKAARLSAGLSQSEVARILGVTFQQVQKYESAANRLPAFRYPVLAEAIGFDITDMIIIEQDTAERDHLRAQKRKLDRLLRNMLPEQVDAVVRYAETLQCSEAA